MLTIYQKRLKERVKPLDEGLERAGQGHLLEGTEPEQEQEEEQTEGCPRMKALKALRKAFPKKK